ncbi:DNA gyrase subunit A [Candidatus Villigracilis affinis]|uniref:DNA gyrase subunit A n=1 Tax=Candidatus Villigracilis affinis TaxID=3140682 RepID=UPI001D61B675|nr:DNA gyrase subunit A [Anaerolineales bacterium]
MELGIVRKIDIDTEMQQSYLDYAMSVIVARALPDARDGLKPVQRRILYAMYDMGIRADTAYKKSARIVGEVLGKYHPHGDSAVYEAMARMAQDFSMRTLLVDGQGNFGSVDGDPPAAMRYTEARLTSAALDILFDLNKDTVDFIPNFDDTLEEPHVLPAAIPNLLVNGATGIAVGMATSIPPHNLSEIVDAIIYMIERWEKLDDIDVEQLMEFVQGPDFPTGGIIIQEKGEEGIESAYGSGRGRITVQAKAHIEEMERSKSRIIVTELPYMVNKSSLIERIAELARDGHLEGLSDLRDESDRQGMRIVLEMTKNAEPEAVLRELYKRTPMQTTFSINLLALVDGEPRTLTLKQALRVYVEHRITVIKRRAEFDLEKAKARAHILEGYLIALKNLDELIGIIRSAPDVETARQKLMKRYKLTELQANAILDMQLRRLAALERKKIETEYKEVTGIIKELTTLLKSPKLMRGVVADELLKVKAAYGDRRRTQIVSLKKGKSAKMLTATDLMPDQTVWVGVTADGIIARTHDDKQPKHSGNDAPRWLVKASTTDTLYLVAENGKAAAIALHVIPESEKLSDGVPYQKAAPLGEDDVLSAMFALPARKSEFPEETCVISITRFGMIKKSLVTELPGPSSQSFVLARVNEGDGLGWVGLTDGKKKDILLVTSSGMAIRFKEDDVRPMGLVAAGVNGIKLDDNDEVVGAEILPAEGEIFLLASDGKAKRVDQKDFPSQGRYGKGVRAWDLPKKITLVGAVSGKPNHMATIVLAKGAPKSARLDTAAVRKRASSRGDVIVEMKKDEVITGLSVAWTVERYVKLAKAVAEEEKSKKKEEQKSTVKKAAPAKKAAVKAKAKPATSSSKGKKKKK